MNHPKFQTLVLLCIDGYDSESMHIFHNILDLQNVHSLASLESQMNFCNWKTTAPNSKASQKFVKLFSHFCSTFCKNPYFSTIFIEFCTDFDDFFRNFAEHSRKCWEVLKFSEFLKNCDNFAEFWQNFNGILMCKDSNDTVAREPYLSTLAWRRTSPAARWTSRRAGRSCSPAPGSSTRALRAPLQPLNLRTAMTATACYRTRPRKPCTCATLSERPATIVPSLASCSRCNFYTCIGVQ